MAIKYAVSRGLEEGQHLRERQLARLLPWLMELVLPDPHTEPVPALALRGITTIVLPVSAAMNDQAVGIEVDVAPFQQRFDLLLRQWFRRRALR